MNLKNTWSASSKSEDFRKSEELTNIAGRWGVGIEVSITKPYTYSRGPVEKRTIRDKIELLPSPTNE